MSTLERAEEEINRGDYALARQLLSSRLHAQGYNDDVLKRLGQVSYEMKDVYQAGRYWFLSSADSEEAKEAIEVFVGASASETRSIVGLLPRHALLSDISKYPAPALQRIRHFGLDEVFARWTGNDNKRGRARGKRVRGDTIGCLAVSLFIVFVFVAGLIQITAWILRAFTD